MSGTLELHPLAAIAAVLMGGELGGVLGVYLSIPVVAAIRIVWVRWQNILRLLRLRLRLYLPTGSSVHRHSSLNSEPLPCSAGINVDHGDSIWLLEMSCAPVKAQNRSALGGGNYAHPKIQPAVRFCFPRFRRPPSFCGSKSCTAKGILDGVDGVDAGCLRCEADIDVIDEQSAIAKAVA